MAGNYAPTITTQSTPFIAVTTSDLTPYTEIQETQGSISYQANSLYYKAETLDQINAPILVQTYDANGDLTDENKVNLADPSQFQTVKNIDLADNPIVFDGRTRIIIPLFPQENVQLFFQTKRVESADFLEGGKKFFSQDFLKTYGFFEDYDVQIKDDLNKIETELNGKYSVDCKDE
jgi:hypothetical protein|tara:strand:- start:516 stop:1046 length:531 start_codon:yes stop_codon:yes gene_type:complete